MMLVTGGTASGKSAFAEEKAADIARSLANKRIIYIATLCDDSAESAEKIKAHRLAREDLDCETAECFSCEALDAVSNAGGVVLLDCLATFVADVVFGTCEAAGDLISHIYDCIARLSERCDCLIVVSDMVFSDGETWTGDMKLYMDTLAGVLGHTAAAADAVVEVVCGIPVKIKGEF